MGVDTVHDKKNPNPCRVRGERGMSAGEELRDQGLEQASRGNQEFLLWARKQAREIAAQHGRVTTDDLRARAAEAGIEPSHYNAWGAVFRTPEWRQVGWQISRRPVAHARYVRVWVRTI